MYINEKSFESVIEDKYKIINAIEQFIQLVYGLTSNYRLEDIYFCSGTKPKWNSTNYPCEKWLSDSSIDADTKRRWLLLLKKINLFEADKSYSFMYEKEEIVAGAEAILNESYIVSLLINEKWEIDKLQGTFSELDKNSGEIIDSEKSVCNLTKKEQIATCEFVSNIVEKEAENYDEMWKRRDIWFPHLVFCPSVERDLKNLEMAYIHQVWKKLRELDNYAEKYGEECFNASLLNHVTPESDKTLQMYEKEHTFYDEDGKAYTMSWHSRFTGIAGRIFFLPKYQKNKILVGYIGKKLKNANYST